VGNEIFSSLPTVVERLPAVFVTSPVRAGKLAACRVPLTPVDKGRPVALVSVKADGVPRFGVVKVGEVAKTTFPLPVAPEAVVPPMEILVPKV